MFFICNNVKESWEQFLDPFLCPDLHQKVTGSILG